MGNVKVVNMASMQYILSLATQVNATPLPAVPEVFGVRLPQASDCLTSIDFDLIPNKPPPGVKLYDEEIEEIEESESEEEDDEEMEPTAIPQPPTMQPPAQPVATPMAVDIVREDAPFPISAIATPSDMDMIGTPMGGGPGQGADEGSDAGEEEDGLFAGGDDEEEESDGMEEVQTTGPSNGIKRKLVEEDDYD